MLNNATLQLHEYTDDTAMTSGSEAYQAALIFYNSVKMAARQDVPGAKAVYEELRKRFPGTRRKPGEMDAESSD
jgi:TolA-binding protein